MPGKRSKEFDPRTATPDEIREQLRKIALLKRDVIFRVSPHLRYEPNPAQYRWLEMLCKGIDQGVTKFGILPCNSDGKTYWLVQLLHAIMGDPKQRNPWFQVDWIQNWRWPKTLRLICSAKDVVDGSGTIWRLMRKCWPIDEYERRKQDHPYDAMFTNKVTGFMLDIRTFDQKVDEHDDGSTIGLLAANEPPPTSIWNCYPARLREGGVMLACATLVRQSEFFKEDIIDNPDARYMHGDAETGNCKQHARLDVVHPETGKPVTLRGYLEHDNLANIWKKSPAHEQEARRTGRPVHLSGAAFAFVPEVHVVSGDKLPRLEDCRAAVFGLDPHRRKPWCMMVVVQDKEGDFWQVDEWPRIDTPPWNCYFHRIEKSEMGLRLYAQQIRLMLSHWRVTGYNSVIDSKYAGNYLTSDHDARKLRERLLSDYHLSFQSGATDVAGTGGGIDILQDILSYDATQEIGFGNAPRFHVADYCRNSIYQYQNETWDEHADPDRYGMKKSLSEKYIDFPRLAMYCVMHRIGRGLTPRPATADELARQRAQETLDEKWNRVSAEFPKENVSLPVDEMVSDPYV